MARILFLTNDLVFPSRVGGVVGRLGAKMETAGTANGLLARLQGAETEQAVVLIDLNTPGVAVQELVGKLKSSAKPPGAIVAFGPHVQEGKLAAAQEAGCDYVMSRGQFDAQIETLLGKLISGDGAK